MPLKVTLHREVVLSDIWMSREDFGEMSRDAVVEVLNEDWLALLEEAGGLNACITDLAWVDDVPERSEASS